MQKADAADPHDEDVVTGDIEEDSEDEHVDAEKDAKEKRKGLLLTMACKIISLLRGLLLVCEMKIHRAQQDTPEKN